MSRRDLEFKPVFEKDLFENTYRMRNTAFKAMFIESNVMIEACAKMAAAFVQRVAQKRVGRNVKYPYTKKTDLELLSQYHSAIHEVAYYWRRVWSLPRSDTAKLAFLMESSLEALLAMGHRPPPGTTSVELFMSLLDPRALVRDVMQETRPNEKKDRKIDEFRESGFKDEVPDDQRILDLYKDVLVDMPFMRRQFRTRLREIVPADFGRGKIARAWETMISAVASMLIWAYSNRFRQADRAGDSVSSQINIRIGAIQVYLMDPFVNLGSVILDQSVAELGESSSSSVGSEFDPLSLDDVLEI